MKRTIALIIITALLLLPVVSVGAAGNGELLITSEKVSGAVGDLVKVHFYLYPNLPDGEKLGSLQGYMKYDSSFVTLGSVSQTDESANLTSWMKGRASKFEYNNEPGCLKFGFFDGYGIEEGGFWFQAEFRIEKEGSTDFIFNGIEYTGLDAEYHTEAYYIEPVSEGGIYTEGQTVPTGAAGETFRPLLPETPTPTGGTTPSASPTSTASVKPTATTKPTATAKPTSTVKPTAKTTVKPTSTAKPAATEKPIVTPTSSPAITAAPAAETPEPVAEATSGSNAGLSETSPEAVPETPAAEADVHPTEPVKETAIEDAERNPNMLLFTGMAIGVVALIGLIALMIVLILKRRRDSEE